jgi:hypothetical protein
MSRVGVLVFAVAVVAAALIAVVAAADDLRDRRPECRSRDLTRAERELQERLAADYLNFEQVQRLQYLSRRLIAIPDEVSQQYGGLDGPLTWVPAPGTGPFPPTSRFGEVLLNACVNGSYFDEVIFPAIVERLVPLLNDTYTYREFPFTIGQLFAPQQPATFLRLNPLSLIGVTYPLRGWNLTYSGDKAFIAKRLVWQIALDKIIFQQHHIGNINVDQLGPDLFQTIQDVQTYDAVPLASCKSACTCFPTNWSSVRMNVIVGHRRHTYVRDRSDPCNVKFLAAKQEGFADFAMPLGTMQDGRAGLLPVPVPAPPPFGVLPAGFITPAEPTNATTGIDRRLEFDAGDSAGAWA